MSVFFGIVFGLLILVAGCALVGVLTFKFLKRYDATGQQITHLADEISVLTNRLPEGMDERQALYQIRVMADKIRRLA